jgi:hypothetical protein
LTDTAAKSETDRAREVEETFRVLPGLYLIGSMEKGVTLYNQQVRAHNLVWALWELQQNAKLRVGRVAVVGGGVSGLAVAACIISRFDKAVSVTLFEERWDICPLQQGSDTRWIHPKIYDWPAVGSRGTDAQLPVLNWSQGRASDVVRTVVAEFTAFCDAFAKSQERLTVYLGLRHFQIKVGMDHKKEVSRIANKATRSGPFFHLGRPEGGTAQFDTVILAIGFGLETVIPGYASDSYWRNEQVGQPVLDGTRHRYLVSGFGDGALVDLCRLTIERFRQDTIISELFKSALDEVETRFDAEIETRGRDANMFDLFAGVEGDLLGAATIELGNRIRKDTRVTLRLRGRNNEIKTFSQIFGRHSSFLHRLLTFLLYKCGAFGLDFSELGTAVKRHGIPAANVLCRYGANTMDHLRALFVDDQMVVNRLTEMKERQQQIPRPLFPPGIFPYYEKEKKE